MSVKKQDMVKKLLGLVRHAIAHSKQLDPVLSTYLSRELHECLNPPKGPASISTSEVRVAQPRLEAIL